MLTNERVHDSVAEPVFYMMGRYIDGAFCRLHARHSTDKNRNLPGASFVALPDSAHLPQYDAKPGASAFNRFYMHGVVSRLTMVAASDELEATAPGAQVYDKTSSLAFREIPNFRRCFCEKNADLFHSTWDFPMSIVNSSFSNLRLPAVSNSSVNRHERAIAPGSFTRMPVDGAGRLAGKAELKVDPELKENLSDVNNNVSTLFKICTSDKGSQCYAIPFTFANGDTAVITGDSKSQIVKARTRRGVVEAQIGAGGPVAIRGLETPAQLHDFLSEFLMAPGWENAHKVERQSKT